MNYIDLHVHSCYSDGTMTPSELVNHGIEQKLVAFALTDHDTMDGIPELMNAAKNKNITAIPGIELSVDYNGKEIHILGYFLDFQNESLHNELQKIANERDMRNKKMCTLLNQGGYPITYEELIKEFTSPIITRAHFAKFLLERNAVASMNVAFSGPLNINSPYFVTRTYLTPKEAISLIIKYGGVAVLAHPLLYKMSVSDLHMLCNTLHLYGLRGIESKYSSNHGNDEAFVKKLAHGYGLFTTGGSDFHGSIKPHIEMGTGMGNLKIPESILEHIKPLSRYSIINEKNKREIVLLRGCGCSWKRCRFCDYHLDYNADDALNFELNQNELAKVTGIYKKLEIINSGSFVDLDQMTMDEIESTCIKCKIKELHFESHWMHRHEISALKARFLENGIVVKVKIGIETFDMNLRENYLDKGIDTKEPAEIAEYFDECCLLQGILGQTLDSMCSDINIGLQYFERVCINIMQNNSKPIKPDTEVIGLFLENIYPLYIDDDRVDILIENTAFGVGGVITNE